jgi:hypothetical protein
MAERHRVRCVDKTDWTSYDDRIRRIGGTNSVGVNWRLTHEEAIDAIEARRWDFYVERAGGSVDVIVAISGFGNKYLKTTADGDEPTDLLALPDCLQPG